MITQAIAALAGRCATLNWLPHTRHSDRHAYASGILVRSMSINGHGEMTSIVSRGGPEGGFVGRLRAAALIAVLAGAAGSIGLMLRAGQRSPRILLVLFAIWVLSPFVALVLAHVVSKRWSVPTRATLYSVMLVATLGSLAIYGEDALRPRKAQPAFVYVAVPPASWLLTAIVVQQRCYLAGDHVEVSGSDELRI